MKIKKQIQALNMKYLRRTKGGIMLEIIRNENVREQRGTKLVLAFIENKQLSW